MTCEEFDNQFDVLYNNITSNQAPGLNTYEKSVFLTKAQDEILKNYFNPKGNKYQEGFDGNQKRQIDFSMITKVQRVVNYTYTATAVSGETDGDDNQLYTITGAVDNSDQYVQAYDENGDAIPGKYIKVSNAAQTFDDAVYDPRANSKSIELPPRVMMIVNERVEVTRGANDTVYLAVVPLTFEEYNRLMSKPYKRPLKYQAWRLINSDEQQKVDLIVGPNDTITNYTMRYIRRPNPIILGNLDGLKIDGLSGTSECELDPILHEEILQRAVELAKVAWTVTGQDNTQSVLQVGQRSE